MSSSAAQPRVSPAPAANAGQDFLALYDEHVDFVWRTVEYLGVPPSVLEDAVQDVFLVVHRRLGDFRRASSVRSWVGGICLRVAKDYRRSLQRRGTLGTLDEIAEVPHPDADPHRAAESTEAAAQVRRLLDKLDDDLRTAFVLAEFADYAAPEIAEMTGANLNTVYSRIRLGRARFNAMVERLRLREEER